MEPLFLDTAYVFALLNTRDQWHARAKQWEQLLARERRPLVTTEYVLVEIADGLASLRFHSQALHAIAVLTTSPLLAMIPASTELLAQALTLYSNRPDKEWGLTDCASFICDAAAVNSPSVDHGSALLASRISVFDA